MQHHRPEPPIYISLFRFPCNFFTTKDKLFSKPAKPGIEKLGNLPCSCQTVANRAARCKTQLNKNRSRHFVSQWQLPANGCFAEFSCFQMTTPPSHSKWQHSPSPPPNDNTISSSQSLFRFEGIVLREVKLFTADWVWLHPGATIRWGLDGVNSTFSFVLILMGIFRCIHEKGWWSW